MCVPHVYPLFFYCSNVYVYEQLVTVWTRHLVTATMCTFQSSHPGLVYIYDMVVTLLLP